jgi:hypothetical protein
MVNEMLWGNWNKYIHYNLTNVFDFITITLIVGFKYVSTFFPQLNIRAYVKIINFSQREQF